MPKPGDVVTFPFPGAASNKRRPAIVVSSALCHNSRPDLILAVVTTNIQAATAPTDYILQDWQAAGLRSPSAFRTYLSMAMPGEVRSIGHLSDRDWRGVRECLQRAMG